MGQASPGTNHIAAPNNNAPAISSVHSDPITVHDSDANTGAASAATTFLRTQEPSAPVRQQTR